MSQATAGEGLNGGPSSTRAENHHKRPLYNKSEAKAKDITLAEHEEIQELV